MKLTIPVSVVLILIFQIGLLVGSSLVPMVSTDQQSLYRNYQRQTSSLNGTTIHTIFEIYSNNLRILSFDALPIVGILSFTESCVVTGRTLSAISVEYNTSQIALLLVLFAFPHTFMEFVSYAIAFTFSLVLTIACARTLISGKNKIPFNSLAILFASAALLLLVAAVVEAVSSLSVVISLVFWIPLIIGILYLRVILKRRTEMHISP